MSIPLLEGEKILKQTCPHFFAMMYLYISWIFLGLVGFFSILFNKEIYNWLSSLSFGQQTSQITFFCMWSIALILPALIISFVRINWGWLFLAMLFCITGIILYYYRYELGEISNSFIEKNELTFISVYVKNYWPFSTSVEEIWNLENVHNYLLMFFSFLGLFRSNSFRRSHRYYITNRRIIARFCFFTIRERDLLYSKVDDLIIHQTILGRIFNFATLIPISASGIGTGGDEASFSAGAEQKLPAGPSLKVTIGGGRSVTVPRCPSFYALYGVPSPEEIKNIILKEMDKREYGYTHRVQEAQKDKKDKKD